MNRAQMFIKKHSSTILTVVGATGVVVTSVLTAKATVKALQLIDEERRDREESGRLFAGNESSYDIALIPDLTRQEIVKMVWKPYIPALISGISTIVCIFGANLLNKRQQASLISAYAVLNNSYTEYRNQVKELYGDDADTKTIKGVTKSNYIDEIVLDEDKELFFDYQSMRWFQSTFDVVQEAEKALRKHLHDFGYACLNDYYMYLNLPPVKHGYDMWWSVSELYQHSDIDFVYEHGDTDDGLEYCIISMPYPPTLCTGCY